jgi:Nif-specific regulatory protein
VTSAAVQPETTADAPLTLAEAEKQHILRVLGQAEGNRTRAAVLLDIGRNTLARKLRQFGIE